MTEINLLPWRELKREQEKKWFTTMLVLGLVVAAFIVFILNYYAKSIVENQISRNQRLKDEITRLDKQIAEIKNLKQIREALISRMLIVQNLQSTRILTVHLFDELIKVMPEGVYITQMERKEDIVTVWGYAQSNTNISELMRNIERNQWIRNPILTEIKKPTAEQKSQEIVQENEFRLSFVLKPDNKVTG
ncbi:pilus assembly protein PilN [Legionella israelensis]|uniref:Pilus assembly protein PilN n=1 Tax=Legionella israelensis TaxID=454 RepID=A0A0W0VUA9_9GAMM|nr:PilN domain-containing protein [Legionella israelensis]KTD23723.1 Tfp pilus assembly protein PilN [Legionella israelensis]QBR84011.1 pilus assembly protein PilN [Legionella israelensis]QBS10897.1 pilus assembly protein PilN [Legionella israelensis]QDP72892.1 pilus assembly protein PilN [Legionella israelensis]SCX80261.1 type IV pilus assembly protein PilN [Legionella israelensis DSM 19235]